MSKNTPDADELDYAFRMGKDSALNGASQVNSHYTIFWHPDMTKSWERGNAEGKSLVNPEQAEKP